MSRQELIEAGIQAQWGMSTPSMMSQILDVVEPMIRGDIANKLSERWDQANANLVDTDDYNYYDGMCTAYDIAEQIALGVLDV